METLDKRIGGSGPHAVGILCHVILLAADVDFYILGILSSKLKRGA